MPIRWPSRWAWASARSGPSSCRKSGTMPSSIFLSRGLDAVVVDDLEAPGEDVAQQAERLGAASAGWRGRGRGRSPRAGPRSRPRTRRAAGSCRCRRPPTTVTAASLRASNRRLKAACSGSSSASRPIICVCHAFDAARADAEAARLGARDEVALDGVVDALDRQRRLAPRPRTGRAPARRCRG